MNVRERVKSALKTGLRNIDDRIKDIVERYKRGELDREAYMRLRGELEVEKGRRVLENLRKMLSGRRSLAE